jgi:hypothetical protein
LLAPTVVLLCACNPAFNWREVSLQGAGLAALLPCKPDHGSRRQHLAGQDVEMQMSGCEAAGVLFALSHVELDHPAKALEAQRQWQTAMLSNMQASTPQLQPWTPKAGALFPNAQRLAAQGRRQDGSALAAQALWFARGAHVYHAVIYADVIPPEAVETFFSGIELQ